VLAGAIYLFDEKTNSLVKQTNYGFEATHHTIALGVGQISACFEKHETITIENMPDNYFKVSSGLGSAMPKHLLLVPLQYEGFCVGVMELASFHEIPVYRLRFIEKLSAQVTATIHTTQISQQTGRLLDESKQQMEELKIREEELKQNLEEMTSIQEDFERRRTEYEQTIQNLNNKIKELQSKK
jgi:GAF domain-containing protein